MKITFKLNQTEYFIEVESNCYIPTKIGYVQDKESKNFGQPKETQLGYFTKLPLACSRCIREEISASDDTLTLEEFASCIEALNKSLLEQLKPIEI